MRPGKLRDERDLQRASKTRSETGDAWLSPSRGWVGGDDVKSGILCVMKDWPVAMKAASP